MSASASLNPSASHHAQLVQKGLGLQQVRRFTEAERCYQLVLRENPNHPDALHLMGLLAVEADLDVLAEARTVVITRRLGVTDSLQHNVTSQ